MKGESRHTGEEEREGDRKSRAYHKAAKQQTTSCIQAKVATRSSKNSRPWRAKKLEGGGKKRRGAPFVTHGEAIKNFAYIMRAKTRKMQRGSHGWGGLRMESIKKKKPDHYYSGKSHFHK